MHAGFTQNGVQAAKLAGVDLPYRTRYIRLSSSSSSSFLLVMQLPLSTLEGAVGQVTPTAPSMHQDVSDVTRAGLRPAILVTETNINPGSVCGAMCG